MSNRNRLKPEIPPSISPRVRKRRNERIIIGGAIVMCGLGLWLASRDWEAVSGPASGSSQTAGERSVIEASRPAVETATAVRAASDDDGESMWLSPTAGEPVSWKSLPSGVQILLTLRPRELLAHSEGEKVLAAIGPMGAEGVRTLEAICGAALRDIDRITVGWQLVEGRLSPTIIAELAAPVATMPAADGWTYLRPDSAGGRQIVAGTAAAITEIQSHRGESPPLRREVERLLSHTDALRHLTLVVLPGALFGEGRTSFDGPFAPLRDSLHWLLGDELNAAALSLHWGENFFVELVAAPTLDTSPPRSAQLVSDRIVTAPNLVESYVMELNASSHGRRVVTRLPEMLRSLAAFSRVGFDRESVLVRSYLPATAGHNLALATELALMERGGGAATASKLPSAPVTSGAATSDGSLRERLRKSITLKMPRDSLEAAINQLARELDISISIVGADLQADGITKNQSLELDVENRAGDEILVEILRRANPDKAATGPADPRQKLVYVIRLEGAGGGEAIIITTRSRAAQRGEKLPAAFE